MKRRLMAGLLGTGLVLGLVFGTAAFGPEACNFNYEEAPPEIQKIVDAVPTPEDYDVLDPVGPVPPGFASWEEAHAFALWLLYGSEGGRGASSTGDGGTPPLPPGSVIPGGLGIWLGEVPDGGQVVFLDDGSTEVVDRFGNVVVHVPAQQ